MTTPITKAIIPVAGWGTRRLPITKSIEKCMLPVGNRPIVDYVVRDCIKAGITEIFFVVSKGSTQLQQYYSNNADLNQFLEYNGKQDLIQLAQPPQNIVFHYIEQDINGKYGTALPAALMLPNMKKDESVALVTGDAFFHSADGSSEIARLLAGTPDGQNAVLSSLVAPEDVSRYGIIDFDEDTGAFVRIVEKPPVDQAPSNQMNTSIFVLNYEMIQRAYNFCQIEISGEYYLTDVVSQAVMDKIPVTVVPGQGEYMDCGNVYGWLHANEVIVRGQ